MKGGVFVGCDFYPRQRVVNILGIAMLPSKVAPFAGKLIV